MTLQVLVCDHHELVRETLCHSLAALPGVRVIGEAHDGRIGVEMALGCRPDLVLMDVRIPKVSCVEATRRIISRCPGTRVLAASAEADWKLVHKMLLAGASGYLLKPWHLEELFAVVLCFRRWTAEP